MKKIKTENDVKAWCREGDWEGRSNTHFSNLFCIKKRSPCTKINVLSSMGSSKNIFFFFNQSMSTSFSLKSIMWKLGLLKNTFFFFSNKSILTSFSLKSILTLFMSHPHMVWKQPFTFTMMNEPLMHEKTHAFVTFLKTIYKIWWAIIYDLFMG